MRTLPQAKACQECQLSPRAGAACAASESAYFRISGAGIVEEERVPPDWERSFLAHNVGLPLGLMLRPWFHDHWFTAMSQARDLGAPIPITFEWESQRTPGTWLVRTLFFAWRAEGWDVYVYHRGIRGGA